MKATSAIHLDTRREKADKKYPLKLRVTYLRERRYYSLGIDVNKDDWKKLNSGQSRGELKDIKIRTTEALAAANSVVRGMDVFSFQKFEDLYFGKSEKHHTVKEAFEVYIKGLSQEGRAGTAESYTNAMRSFFAYKSNLRFADITPEFLAKYEDWMLKRNRSFSTIGIYLRSARTLINLSIDAGVIKREQYPFGKRRYQIPTGANIKKSLSLHEVAALYYQDLPMRSPKDKARDFWMFSYLANGMNFKDICRLRFSNIQNDTIVFYRAKTQRSRRSNPLPILVILTDDLKRIIDKWGNVRKNQDYYIFPIFFDGISPRRERELVKQWIKVTNKWLSKVAKDVGIGKITTYSARHSFSTILRNCGASIQYIKESLGHNSTQTTENYLNTYPDDLKRKFAQQLTSFKVAS